MLDESWEISPQVSVRQERFGALLYHFGNRKLTFVKKRDLVTVLESLESQASVRAALESSGVAQSAWSEYVAALGRLASSDIIRPSTSTEGVPSHGHSAA